MKKLLSTLLLAFTTVFLYAQIPSAMVETLEGTKINTETIQNDGKPIVISFWATWCKPCVKELNAIHENFEDWTDETDVKLYAVSIDNSRSKSRVAPFANSQGWDYEVLLDPNGEFKRVMNVVNVPHTFVLDANLKVVYQHTTFADGDEEELYEIIKKVAAGEKIE